MKLTKPNGLILIGIPCWTGVSFTEYCERYDASPDEFVSISQYLSLARELNLHLLYSYESSVQEIDEYQAYQWRFRLESDRLKKIADSQEHYYERIRRLSSWCLMLFRKS